MEYFIIGAGILWFISGLLMTYQTYLYTRQCKLYENKGEMVVVGKNQGGFFSSRVSVIMAVDRRGNIREASILCNTGFMRVPRIEKLEKIIGENIIECSFARFRELGDKVRDALCQAAEGYKIKAG